MNIKELIEHLRSYRREQPCAYALWLPDDIRTKAEEMGLTLSDEQIAAVLEGVQNKHDASIGINWDVIEYWITEVTKQPTGGM